jgi:lysozyme family protein
LATTPPFKLGDLIGDILVREGGSVVTNDPNDSGGRTEYGISEKANPEAWKTGSVSEATARAIYLKKYVQAPGFDQIPPGSLQAQLVDFGVVSGPAVAITKLQHILGVAEDGVLGPATLAALSASTLDVNKALVMARVLTIAKLVVAAPKDLKFLVGWTSRALEFL